MAVGRTHADLIDDLKDEFINCKICTKQYTMTERRPKELPCRHTYCSSCINTIVPQPGQCQGRCPYCRAPFDLDDEGADKLQDNLTIKQLLDFLKVSKPEPMEGITCDECSRGNKSVSWCYHCRHSICRKCEESHAEMRSFSGHITESLDIVKVNEARKIYYCEQHKQEKLQKFCECCQEVICFQCTLISHHVDKGHKVVDLASVQEKHLTELNKIVDEVMSIQQKAILKSCIATKKTDMLDTNYRSCTEDMDSFLQKFQSTVNETIVAHFEKLKKYVDAFKLSAIDQFKKETEAAEIFLSHIGSTVETFQPILDRKCPVEIARTLHVHSRSLTKLVNEDCKSLPDTGEEGGPVPNVSYSLLSFTHNCENLASIIANMTAIEAFNVVPAYTKVSVENGVIGVPCRFIIKLHNRNKQPCNRASKDIKVEATVCPDESMSSSPIVCQVHPTSPGEYEAQFTPHTIGYHNVILKVMGESVISPLISVGEFCIKILQDESQSTVRANVILVSTDNCKVSIDLQNVEVQCLGPRSEIVKPVEHHFAKDIVEAKFNLKCLGKHSVRAVYCGNPIKNSEDLVINKTQQLIGQGGKGPGNLQDIADLVVLPCGTLLVLDLQAKRGKTKCHLILSTWNSNGKFIGTTYTSIEGSQYHKPSLAVGYLSGSNVCVCSNDETDAFQSIFFTTPSLKLKKRELKLENVKPLAIAMNSEGIIFMCSSESKQIKAFSPDGKLHSIIDVKDFEIKNPIDICIDCKDNVFICDIENNCIHMLNSDHKFVKTFGKDGEINEPIAIAVDSCGTLFILGKGYILVIQIDNSQIIDTLECSSRKGDKIACTKDNYIIITNKSKSNLIKLAYCNTHLGASC
ncbi:tripartite motif-containing protein 2-like [Anneissia japonica]|uniref:tripartite motif-containing protein 2-like n=1 Tax=Anneissia japonica TaxID=1529436 RepID=UPI0014255173|nr:tripartite motif-containing protein 2-like [Anneissia japonica]